MQNEKASAKKTRNHNLEGKADVKNLNLDTGKLGSNSKNLSFDQKRNPKRLSNVSKASDTCNEKKCREKKCSENLEQKKRKKIYPKKKCSSIGSIFNKNNANSEYFSTKKNFNLFPHKENNSNLIGLMETFIRANNQELENCPLSMEKIKNAMFEILEKMQTPGVKNHFHEGSRRPQEKILNMQIKTKHDTFEHSVQGLELRNIFTIKKSNLKRVWESLNDDGSHTLVNKILLEFYEQIQKKPNKNSSFPYLSSERTNSKEAHVEEYSNQRSIPNLIDKIGKPLENERVSFSEILRAKYLNRDFKKFENRTSVDQHKKLSVKSFLNKRDSSEL